MRPQKRERKAQTGHKEKRHNTLIRIRLEMVEKKTEKLLNEDKVTMLYVCVVS